MFRQEVKLAKIPDKTLAISMPRARPDTTMERELARRCAGARSPTRGSMSCGVTVLRRRQSVSTCRSSWPLEQSVRAHDSEYLPDAAYEAQSDKGVEVISKTQAEPLYSPSAKSCFAIRKQFCLPQSPSPRSVSRRKVFGVLCLQAGTQTANRLHSQLGTALQHWTLSRS